MSDSTDFNPSIDVLVAKGDKMSIQVPKSSKYHKVKRIQEADFLQYFNQTLYKLGQLDTCGGEYYIDTEDNEHLSLLHVQTWSSKEIHFSP